MMTTAKQTASNRRNAQKSTGPRSMKGRLRSSQNALQHGLFAYKPVLPHEDPAVYAHHRAKLAQQFKPVGYFEELLVDQITDLMWRLRRVAGIETAVFEAELDKLQQTETRAAITKKANAVEVLDRTIMAEISRTCEAEQKNKPRPLCTVRIGTVFINSLQHGAFEKLSFYETRKLRELEKLLVMLGDRQQQQTPDKSTKPSIQQIEVEGNAP